MAEARCGQDQSMRDSRDSGGGRRHSRGPNASAERNKPEQPSSSQGALSSIRAAIMRTSRSTSQEQHRERRSHRRPQITILSAEPMAPSWYPAAPPPSAVQVPPPSYEQVLREKSREQQQHPHPHLFSSSSTPPPPSPSPAPPAPPAVSSVTPSPAPPPPAPSRSTIATQTDAPPLPPPPAVANTTPQTTTAADRPATRPSLRRPPRPPKPPCPPRPDGDALIRAPTPTPTPTQTSTHTPTHTTTRTQTDQPPEKEEEEEAESAAAAARPRPRPRSRAGLRPISQEVSSSQPISSLGSIPKSRSMCSEIVVAQPIGGGGGESKLASQPISSERTGNGAGEDQSDGVCLGAEGVCAGGSQYLQDLLDVFGPNSSARGHALSHADTGSHLVEEEEEEEDEEGGKEVAMTMAVALPPVVELEVEVGVEQRGAMGGTSPRPVPRPRSRQTETLTPPPPSVSGSPSPPQPQPRRRSLSTSSNTSQTSSQALDGPTAPKPGLPPRLLPLRPPPIKPAKPPHLIGSCPTTTANQEQGQRLPKRGPPLPPRPKPGHALYKNSQKEEFDLLDLSDTLDDLNTHTDIQTCANTHPDIPAGVKDAITDTPLMTNASVNTSTHTHTDTQTWADAQSSTTEGRWDQDGTPPKSLSAQQPDSIILSEGKHAAAVMSCVAIFAFRGEERDELSFCEGDVITLTGYVNEEWGRGLLRGHAGIFPLCFTSSPQPQELHKVDANTK